MAKKKKKNAKKRKAAAAPTFTAETADRHQLYQYSVQDADFEVSFTSSTFRSVRGRHALSLREDFCGTAMVCAEWVRSRKGRTAVGLDLDPDVLAWGQEHNIDPLGKKADRVDLRGQNVLEKTSDTFDLITAMNFSYFLFDERPALLEYFRSVHAALVSDGVFILDSYGGWESQQTMEEPREIAAGFTYIWEQAAYNPIDSRITNHIHFEFEDGTELRKAFTYVWRLWTPREVTDLLLEAGFSKASVYWEDEDGDGEGTGVYRRREVVTNDPGWLAFIVAAK